MISANIVQTGFKISGMENASLSTGNTEDISTSATDFSSFMNSYGSADNGVTSGEAASVNDVNVQTVSQASEKIKVLFTAKNQNTAGEIPEEVMVNSMAIMAVDEAAMQLIRQVMEVIKSDTGCSEEELTKVMNDIGAEPYDLLSADIVKNVVLELNGLSGPQELLVNQDAYTQYTGIIEEIQLLKDDFSVTYDFTPEQSADMPNIIKQLIPQENNLNDFMQEVSPEYVQTNKIVENYSSDAVQQDVTVMDYTGEKVENTEFTEKIQNTITTESTSEIPNSESAEIIPKAENLVIDEVSESVEKPENAKYVLQDNMEETVEEFDNNVSQKKDIVNIQSEYKDTDESFYETENNTSSPATLHESDISQDNSSGFGEKRQDSGMKQNNFVKTSQVDTVEKKNVHNTDFTQISNNLFEHIKESVSNVHTTQTQTTSFATRIFNQVMEGIKVISSEEMSSIEMQLQPENLGKLNIQVVSKNGVITAQILTQNEAVKQAIESQMYVLKENMNNQEIAIEDVEVTVSSHAFEQGMDNGNNDNSENRQKRRKFRTDDDVQSVSSDIKAIKEELLEKAMKEQNGSTVSYTA